VYFQNLRRRTPDRKTTISRGNVPLITVDQAVNFLRSVKQSDNDAIGNAIMSIQRNIELYAGIRIDTGTFDAYFNQVGNEFDIHDIPATISDVYEIGWNGAERTLTAGTDYAIWQGQSPTVRFLPDYLAYFTRLVTDDYLTPMGYRVRYTAGHSDVTTVTPQVRLAMEHELAFYFKNRQDGDQQQIVISGELTVQAKNLLDPIRLRK
jgi:hypothetical protein